MERDQLFNDKREAILRIAASYGARSVRVFGSLARGETRPDSDLDLLVVTDTGAHIERVLEVLINAIPAVRRRFGLRLSPLILEKARVQERYRDGDPLMQNVLSEGRTLYGTHFHEMVDAW